MLLKGRNIKTLLFCFALFFLLSNTTFSQSMFANSSYETGTNTNCNCPTGYTCMNDAGRVVSGFHPNFVVGNQGCIGGQNYFPPFGAHTGSCCVYFYAGLDRVTTPNGTFAAGDKACCCVWYAGPQGSGASGQNTANCYFRIGVDGVAVSPSILVPVNTTWTQYCFLTAALTAGSHNFSIMSGGAAQYSIWNDDFTVNICTTLPVELVDFEARNLKGKVILNWKTMTEQNNDYFTIEKSTDGANFSEVTTVKGAGNSNKILHYNASDDEPATGISYYRLKQTDANKAFTYSQMVYVNSETEINPLVYPNPSTGTFKMNIENEVEAAEVILVNALGQIVHRQSVSKGETEINLPGKDPGIYNILVFENNKKVFSSRITIQ